MEGSGKIILEKVWVSDIKKLKKEIGQNELFKLIVVGKDINNVSDDSDRICFILNGSDSTMILDINPCEAYFFAKTIIAMLESRKYKK
jgi:hypothetical protein